MKRTVPGNHFWILNGLTNLIHDDGGGGGGGGGDGGDDACGGDKKKILKRLITVVDWGFRRQEAITVCTM